MENLLFHVPVFHAEARFILYKFLCYDTVFSSHPHSWFTILMPRVTKAMSNIIAQHLKCCILSNFYQVSSISLGKSIHQFLHLNLFLLVSLYSSDFPDASQIRYLEPSYYLLFD